MTDLHVVTETAPRRDTQTLRVPIAMVGPVYGLIAAVIGLGWTWSQANTDVQARLAGLQKDSAAQTRALNRIEPKVDGMYPRAEADREFGRVWAQLDDHEARLRKRESL